MRALHVLTVAASDGSYGGPLRVSVVQAQALGPRGYQVEVIGGSTRKSDESHTIDGISVTAYAGRKLGRSFASVVSLRLFLQVFRRVRQFDIVHIHAGRDIVALGTALICVLTSTPFLMQPHGMISRCQRLTVRLLDSLIIKPLLGRAETILALTSFEEAELAAIFQHKQIRKIFNAVQVKPISKYNMPQKDRRQLDVLFCSRLHPRKRPETVAEVAARLDYLDQVRFSIVGNDEGSLSGLQSTVDRLGVRTVIYEGPLNYSMAAERISRADILLLPSVNEPFPMCVLEAMATGVPVVITDSCGLKQIVSESNCGIVCRPDAESLARAVEALLNDSALRYEMGINGASAIKSKLSVDALGLPLAHAYQTSIRKLN